MRDFENGGRSEPSRPFASGISTCWGRAGKFFMFLVLGFTPIAFVQAASQTQTPQVEGPAVRQTKTAAKEPVAQQPASVGKSDPVAPAEAVKAAAQDPAAMETARLLKLATELKAEVNKTNKDILSIRVVKTAEEIEKLSRTEQRELRASLASR